MHPCLIFTYPCLWLTCPTQWKKTFPTCFHFLNFPRLYQAVSPYLNLFQLPQQILKLFISKWSNDQKKLSNFFLTFLIFFNFRQLVYLFLNFWKISLQKINFHQFIPISFKLFYLQLLLHLIRWQTEGKKRLDSREESEIRKRLPMDTITPGK